MEINKANLPYIPANNVSYRNNTIPAASYSAYALPEYQYQHYQYPSYSPNTQTTDINATMRSQILPASSEGYREIETFNAPFLDKGKFYKLDNGQNVIIIPKKGPTTIKTFTKVGSFNEEKNRGISHYIEHNLFNGSSLLGPNEFVEKTTRMGGQYNAGTNTTNTDYYIKSPMHKEGDFEKFMTMHADMLLNPSFTDKMLEKFPSQKPNAPINIVKLPCREREEYFIKGTEPAGGCASITKPTGEAGKKDTDQQSEHN